MTIPIAPTIGLIVGLIEPVEALLKGNFKGALYAGSRNYLGYMPKAQRFNLKLMARGLLPLAIGLLVHKFVGGRLGVNRMLGRAKVPLLRI